ncbi:MAG: hypothetical protein ACRCYU_09110 [Nocardioides sp.]
MTKQRSFKRLVRARMAKTSESYTTARRVLLTSSSGSEPATAADATDEHAVDVPRLVTTDAAIRERTGYGWEEWFDLLDESGGMARSHRDNAKWVAERLDITPLAWPAQAVTTSYERAKGLRVVGQRDDGFTVTASRTVAVPAERLFDALVNAAVSVSWPSGVTLSPRTATPSRTARFDVVGHTSRVLLTFDEKGPDRSTVTVEHSRLADPAAADQFRSAWRQTLAELKATLEQQEVCHG